jgi:hypothetical protein
MENETDSTPKKEPREPKKRGRVPTVGTDRYNVIIDEGMAEWAKHQPEGLSGLIRLVLAKEREEREAKK